MKYYKDNQNNIYAYELDGSQDHLIGDKVAMTAEEVELHINPPKTPEQIQAEIDNAIQNLLDTTAQSFRYDNMMSARSYSGYVNHFQTEAQALAVWASNCWVVAGDIEADVLAGIRPMPTVDEVLSELPIYEAV